MKNLKAKIVVIALLMLCVLTASAYDFEVDGIYYKRSGDNVNVTYQGDIGNYNNAATSYHGVVNIPEKVTYNSKDYAVIGITFDAFSGCTNLKMVNMANSITTIGSNAFYDCSSLVSVILSESVETIEKYTFCNCSSLTSITIPNSVTEIKKYAFLDCSNLENVTMGESVTNIGPWAFWNCPNINSPIVGPSVLEVGNHAFYECSRLPFFHFPKVKTIGEGAFADCSGLTNITLPSTLTSIEDITFSGCKGLTSVVIPNSVTNIGKNAFSQCNSIKSLTIGQSVQSIGERAFSINNDDVDITCLALAPPVLAGDGSWLNSVFSRYNDLHVYKGLKDVYQNTGGEWAKFNIIDDVELIKVKGIVLDNDQYECLVNKSGQAVATITNEDASIQNITWTSSNPSVLFIDDKTGEFWGLQIGESTITAAATDGSGVSTSAIVKVVEPIFVSTIDFDHTTIIIDQNESATITATIAPENAHNKCLEWTSSNDNIASVVDGVITGHNGGVATITAKTTDGSNISASCTVVVDGPLYDYNNYLESSFTGQYSKSQIGSIIKKSIGFYIENKGSESITITKGNVRRNSNDAIVASSTDASVLGVLKPGERNELSFTVNEDASLGAFYYEWFYTYKGHECVFVSNAPKTNVDVYSVSLDIEEVTMREGDIKKLAATVHPSIASDHSITWESSNSKIAKVDANGQVTAVGVGETDITAKANSGVSAVCHIIVEATPVETIEITASKTEIEIGETMELMASILPNTATNKSVRWTSNNEDVAMVSSNGTVVGVDLGSATITAEAADGSGVKATIEITVVPIKVKSITLNHDTYSLCEGESVIIEATVLPEDAANKEIVWASSNDNVVMVSKTGKVMYVCNGNATVTATATDGSGVSASCTFSCTDGIVTITLDNDNIKVYDANGIELSGTKRGVNIIKTTNGTTRKVIKK